MKAIGYFRFSEEHEREHPSLVEQQEEFLRFCQQRGYQQLATFVDVDSQGKISSAKYRQMVDYIRRKGEELLVVVKTPHHLNPDPQEAVLCLLELEGLGARAISSAEELADPLEMALQNWSAQREERGGRVKDAMKLKAIKGKGLGRPPLGYRLGANKKLEVVLEEAAIVRLIYGLYLEEKMGFRRITRYLNEQGITTKTGGRWSIVGVRDILRNRAYLGTYARFGIRVPDSHPSIIPAQFFRRVQEQLDAKPKPRRYVPKSPFLLSGLAYCGDCGNRMTGVSRRQSWIRRKDRARSVGEYRYYQCQSRTNQSICHYHTRRTEDLEGMVLATLGRINSPEALQLWLGQQLPATDSTPQRPQLKRRLGALERRFRTYLEQAAQGAISLEELRAMGGEVVRERQPLKRRLAHLEAEEQGEQTEKERREHLLEMLRQIQERWDKMTFPARKALLKDVIDRIVVYDDRVETLLQA